MTERGQVREAILDAAEAYLLGGGFASSRMLSAVADRAGVSRPTVYKYVGDRDAITAALVQRHLAAFLLEAAPIAHRRIAPRRRLVEFLAFTVEHARAHPLLNAALRDSPYDILLAFSLDADAAISQVTDFARPIVEQVRDETGASVATDAMIDWLCRIAISLVFTRGPVDTHSRAALVAHLETLFDIGGVLAPQRTEARRPRSAAAR